MTTPTDPTPPPARSGPVTNEQLLERIGALESRLAAATAQEQTRDMFLRRRAGWILGWAVLAALASCNAVGSSSDSSRLSTIETKLDSIASAGSSNEGLPSREEVLDLCSMVGRLAQAQKVTLPPQERATACRQAADGTATP